MFNLASDFTFCRLTPELASQCREYSCSKNPDISEFFHKDYVKYADELLGKSYCFVTKEESAMIACAFTLANSAVNMQEISPKRRNRFNRPIPNAKRSRQYPAVLIGRLAVFDGFEGHHLGYDLMDFIKAWFIDPLNKTGCRFLIVDAVNHPKVIDYYCQNGFTFLFENEEEENIATNNGSKKKCATRLMYFDLIKLRTGRPVMGADEKQTKTMT